MDLDDAGVGGVVVVGLPGDLVALGVLADDLSALGDGRREGLVEGDPGVGLGVPAVVVNLARVVEGFGSVLGKLGLDGLLIAIDGAVISNLLVVMIES